jgi:hypothetical protein
MRGTASFSPVGLTGGGAFLGKGVPAFSAETGENPMWGSSRSAASKLDEGIMWRGAYATATAAWTSAGMVRSGVEG